VWVAVSPTVGTAAEVAAYLRSRGILVSVPGPQVIRACTHLDVSTEQVEYAAEIIRQIEPALISAMTLVY
jgi:threonine aldolase